MTGMKRKLLYQGKEGQSFTGIALIKDKFVRSLSLEAEPIAPNLKCIHLTDINLNKFERAHWIKRHLDQWELWISEFRDARIRFEFSTGDLVTVPVDFVCFEEEGWYFPEEGLEFLDG